MNAVNLEAVLNHINEAMVVIDLSGEVLYYNEVATTYNNEFNIQLGLGKSFFDAVSPEREVLERLIVKEVTDFKRPQSTEAEYKNDNGQFTFFEITYNPVLNTEQAIDKICIITRDITHQKTFEKKTVQLVDELSSLIETANAFIFGLDGRGYIVDWNKESARVTGFTKNDVLARPINQFIEEPHVSNFNILLDRVNQGEAVSNVELEIKTKKDEPRSILLNATPKLSATGQVIGSLFVGQDISELSQYRYSLEQKIKDHTQKLEEALQKEKDLVEIKNKFISIASHEFKIPLGVISSSVQFLKKNPVLTVKERERIINVESQVAIMKTMLEDILASEKFEATKLAPSLQRVDLIHFLKTTIEDVVNSTQKTHTVITHFPGETLYFESDEKLLRNIFINLLSNAIKFSPEHDNVNLTVHTTAKYITVTIQDFGIGIDKEDLERVFEPFNRGSNTGTIKGTGLGLSIVKKAIEVLKGDLSVDSNSGKGTTFTVRFKTL